MEGKGRCCSCLSVCHVWLPRQQHPEPPGPHTPLTPIATLVCLSLECSLTDTHLQLSAMKELSILYIMSSSIPDLCSRKDWRRANARPMFCVCVLVFCAKRCQLHSALTHCDYLPNQALRSVLALCHASWRPVFMFTL